MTLKVKWNRKEWERLRLDPEIVADLEDRAKRIAEAANKIGGSPDVDKGYVVVENKLRTRRGGVSVIATGHAANSNRKHQSLLKALPAGK